MKRKIIVKLSITHHNTQVWEKVNNESEIIYIWIYYSEWADLMRGVPLGFLFVCLFFWTFSSVSSKIWRLGGNCEFITQCITRFYCLGHGGLFAHHSPNSVTALFWSGLWWIWSLFWEYWAHKNSLWIRCQSFVGHHAHIHTHSYSHLGETLYCQFVCSWALGENLRRWIWHKIHKAPLSNLSPGSSQGPCKEAVLPTAPWCCFIFIEVWYSVCFRK